MSGLVSLEYFCAGANRIGDLSPLAGLTSLYSVGLESNDIANLIPLSGLTRLDTLNLSDNAITDLSPLVANPGFNEWGVVDVTNNPIDCRDQADNIQALLDRYVALRADCP